MQDLDIMLTCIVWDADAFFDYPSLPNLAVLNMWIDSAETAIGDEFFTSFSMFLNKALRFLISGA
jgi:hypothetical protein